MDVVAPYLSLICEDVPLTTLNFESSLSVCVGGAEALVHDLGEVARITTVPSAAKAQRSTPPSIPWALCRPFTRPGGCTGQKLTRLPETLAGLPSLARLCLRSPKAIPLSL